MAGELFTIGYEGVAQQHVLDALKSAGVEMLVDVRAIAASRRPGFAKSALKAGVASVGIDYLHLRALGTPADGRLAARTGRYDDMRRIFEAHLATPEPTHELEALRGLIGQKRCCLLCFERQPHHCHRLVVAEHLAPASLHHLLP